MSTPDASPQEAGARSIDGYTAAEASARADRDQLSECEACRRFFDVASGRLWVAWSGSSITCVHCFMLMNAYFVLEDRRHGYPVDDDEREELLEFVTATPDESGAPIGGLEAYRARFGPDHQRAPCPRVDGCLLCEGL